jgi:hypothetical protein
VGFYVANNRMAEAASGEFILLLNNDPRQDVPPTSWSAPIACCGPMTIAGNAS